MIFPDSTDEPPSQLKGFAKVELKPGKRRRVQAILDSSSFSTWSTAEKRWTVVPGEYVLRAGTSSRDLTAQVAVSLR